MLYIHRANRDAAIRRRLMRQLEETQHDLAERAREAGVLDERQRLARDLHDTLAQAFTSVVKHLEAVELAFGAGAAAGTDAGTGAGAGRGEGSAAAADAIPRALVHVAHAEQVSRESLAELRRIVWALRPAPLAESSLGAAIERITAHWGEANGVVASALIDAALPPLQPDAEVILLRATQELLSNVAKHARATRVEVSVSVADGLVMLTVEDDGTGFVEGERMDGAERGAGGMGFMSIRERARPFGGRVMIDSVVGQGTSVTVALPLDVVAAA
jgi:signal transduction histidine kinase